MDLQLSFLTCPLSCAALSLELERHSLTLCYYVYLSCPNCGELRAAIEEIPTDRFLPCPSCRQKVLLVDLHLVFLFWVVIQSFLAGGFLSLQSATFSRGFSFKGSPWKGRSRSTALCRTLTVAGALSKVDFWSA